MGKSAKNKQAALSAKMFEATEKQLERYNEEQTIQRELLETQKEKYRGFEFKNPYHGEGLFQGVMSDEVPQKAVTEVGGYDTVNYDMLDVEFKQI